MILKEFPTIRIDDFRNGESEPQPELCFLTHMHEDHTAGLSRKSYYGPVVYCSGATRAFLLNFRAKAGTGELKYNHLRKEVSGKELISVIEFDKPVEFDLKSGQKVLVTFIDANHCPGAAMVLIQPRQGDGPAILFTGDVRCETWHLNALSHNPSLSPFLANFGGERLISLYVDDTFAAHADPYKDYVENYVGIDSLARMLLQYPEEVHFCLTDSTTGYEEVMISLAQRLNSKIHMDVYHYNMYQLASDFSPLAKRLLSHCTMKLRSKPDKSSGKNINELAPVRIHFCQKNFACPYRDPHSPMAYLKPCNQPPPAILKLQNAIHEYHTVPEGIMEPFEETPNLYKGPDQRYFLCLKTQKFFPLFPWFYFSRHASFSEIGRLKDLVQAQNVRSLAGVPLQIFGRAANNMASEDRKASSLCALYRLPRNSFDTLAGPSALAGDMPLPILPKKAKIQPFQKRLNAQRQRILARHRKAKLTDSDSFCTSSEEEEDCHTALMMLACPMGECGEPMRAVTSASKESSLSKNRTAEYAYDQGRRPPHEGPHFERTSETNGKESSQVQADENRILSKTDGSDTLLDDSSTLPSPPASPKNAETEAIVSCKNIEEPSFIDESPESSGSCSFDALVEKLRVDPDYWFDIKKTCLKTG